MKVKHLRSVERNGFQYHLYEVVNSKEALKLIYYPESIIRPNGTETRRLVVREESVNSTQTSFLQICNELGEMAQIFGHPVSSVEVPLLTKSSREKELDKFLSSFGLERDKQNRLF